MELTLEQIRDWESHPVTKEIMSIVDEEIDAEIKQPKYLNQPTQSADEVAMRVAFSDGVVLGASGLKDIAESLVDRLKDDDDE